MDHTTVVVTACEEWIGEHEQFMVIISMDIRNPERLYKKVHYTNSVLTLHGISEHNFYTCMFNFHDIMCPKMHLATILMISCLRAALPVYCSSLTLNNSMRIIIDSNYINLYPCTFLKA